MTESSIHAPPRGGRLMLSSRHHHSAAQFSSHQRQPCDDFISHLSPINAVDVLRSSDGPLKTCLDAATATERSLAIRAAVVSKTIYERLDELLGWPWPRDARLAFQPPARTKHHTASPRGRAGRSAGQAPEGTKPAEQEEPYFGSLTTSAVAHYEIRIDEINDELEKLEIEDIKKHVLQKYAMPPSRPASAAESPSLNGHRDRSSLAHCAKLDDLTAAITTMVLQALPNLSKLLRLMSAWSTRLTVLRQVPSWQAALDDAESAVKSSWFAMKQKPGHGAEACSTGQSPATPPISPKDFYIVSTVMEETISKAARLLDYMLDTLEGQNDTLPNEWIERMEDVKGRYDEWVAAFDRTLRGAQFATLRDQAGLKDVQSSAEGSACLGDDRRPTVEEEAASPEVMISIEYADDCASRLSRESRATDDTSLNRLGGADWSSSRPYLDSCHASNTCSVMLNQGSLRDSVGSTADLSKSDFEADANDFLLESSGNGSKPSLTAPPMANNRSRSAVPKTSIMPVHHRDAAKTPDLAPLNNNHDSPHTSPCEVRSMPRNDMSPVFEKQKGDEKVMTLGGLGSPIVLSGAANGEDDHHLRQQISNILDIIPANIQLDGHATSINHLNPPDLPLPYGKPKAATEQCMQSMSSMSSRASTPSFVLAPVSRPRHQNGHQDIKLYHLSRANGEAAIKLFIRCVGANGERVMVRVGGGWADLGEYLKEYAIHHGRRSHGGVNSKVEIRDVPRPASALSYQPSASPQTSRMSPSSRPGSAAYPTSPIYVVKTRKHSTGEEEDVRGPRLPRTPLTYGAPHTLDPPPSSGSGSTGRSRSSSRFSWTEEDSSLGMAGPRPRSTSKDISQESLQWVESVKEKVRVASGGSDMERAAASADSGRESKFGELGKVGATKRLFRRGA